MTSHAPNRSPTASQGRYATRRGWRSRHLEKTLGFRRITRVADLRPGDIVFTEHADYPWHVYVFHSWRDRKRGIARVIDNQGPLHDRNVWSTGSGNWTPFAYACAPRADRWCPTA